MQAISSSTSSSSSSSQPADGRPDSTTGMEELQRLHLHSPPPPPPDHIQGKEELQRLHLRSPPPPHRKDRKKHHPPRGHHGAHSPPPHHRGHSAHKLRHLSPPPPPTICVLHSKKKDKLRVKHPKHCKKVRKLHRKLMKACKHLKGTAHHDMLNVCLDAGQLASPFNPAVALHHPGCCLHNRDLSMVNDEMLAKLGQHPPCLEARGGHHGHRHPHRHGRHGPHVRSEVRHRTPPPMPPRHEAVDMQAEPALESVVPGNRLLLADA